MSDVTQDDRTMGMIAHLSAIVAIGPLIIWMMNKDNPEKAFVSNNAKEALNFQITLLAVAIPLDIVLWIMFHIPVIGWIIGFALGGALGLLGLVALVFFIVAGLKANEGQEYKYPVSLRLVK